MRIAALVQLLCGLMLRGLTKAAGEPGCLSVCYRVVPLPFDSSSQPGRGANIPNASGTELPCVSVCIFQLVCPPLFHCLCNVVLAALTFPPHDMFGPPALP